MIDRPEWYERSFEFGPFKVRVVARPKSSPLGRFGGGWQYAIGVHAATGFQTVIVHLWSFYVRISRR